MIEDSKRWLADLDETAALTPLITELEGKTVLVTGAAGLVCSPLVDLLLRYNETHTGKIRVLAAGRWLEEMTDRFGSRVGTEYLAYVPYDAARTNNQLDTPCDYIIHGASNASPDMVMREPVETMLSNFLGIRYLLETARRVGARRVLYISSSEVYGRKETDAPFHEDEYGYVDLLNPRNSYAVSKRAAETLCAAYAAEYGVESVIVRPGHIYGPTASPRDSRVSSAWAWAAAQGKDIVMKSDGAQLRSYCHCLDCATAILTVLLRGENAHAYNISNPNAIVSIRQMAEILTAASGTTLRLELPSDAERRAFNPMSNSSLDSASLEALGWRGQFDAERGFAETVEVMREMERS